MDKYQTRINRGHGINPGSRPGTSNATPKQAPGATARRAHDRSGHDTARLPLTQVTRRTIVRATALAGSTFAMALFALTAHADITEDCILEGTVDMRMAEQLGQPVYVRFRNAERGSEARCSLTRRSNSRRVKFISSPDEHDLDDASHGDRVRYRYTERDGNPGTWQLIEVKER
jgi:2-methylaconitate cis-trans-isomerase PrpF